MNKKWLKLAGEMLGDYAGVLGNSGCNDWSWPADWTYEEKLIMAMEMIAYNVRAESTTSLSQSQITEARGLADRSPADFFVAGFLAHCLKK